MKHDDVDIILAAMHAGTIPCVIDPSNMTEEKEHVCIL